MRNTPMIIATVAFAVVAFLAASSAAFQLESLPDGLVHNEIVQKLAAFEVVTPQHHASMSTLSADEPAHFPSSLSYTVNAFGQEFSLDLKKNEDLFSPDYVELKLDYGGDSFGQELARNSPKLNCFYRGSVNNDPTSHVALSACSGLRGVIHSGGKEYNIEPAAFASAPSTGFTTSSVHGHKLAPSKHAVMSAEHVFPLARLSNVQHLFYRSTDVQGGSDSWKCGSHNHAHDSQTAGFQPLGQPRHAVTLKAGETGGTKYIELLAFNDKARYDAHGQAVEHDTASIMNLASQYYAQTTFAQPIHLVLVGQATFVNGDPYKVRQSSSGSGVDVQSNQGLLNIFNQYHTNPTNNLPRHDNGQLLSGLTFEDGIRGLAGVGAMCSSQSGSITQQTSPILATRAMIAAHETGHTLSMQHDGVANSCQNSGFIMQTTTAEARTFSPCSITATNQFLRSGINCLDNFVSARPASIVDAQAHWEAEPWGACSRDCGNGFQIRVVQCVTAAGKAVPESACSGEPKPSLVRSCEQEACDPCALDTCTAHGACQVQDKKAICVCKPGFSGDKCEIAPSVTVGAGSGHLGRDNQIEIEWTTTGNISRVNILLYRDGEAWPEYIAQGIENKSPYLWQPSNALPGPSLMKAGTYHLRVSHSEQAAVFGDSFDFKVESPCTYYICQNGGVCKSSEHEMATCDCAGTGFTGEFCDVPPQSPCAAFPCLNGGQCLLDGDIPRCDCSPGNGTGLHCETRAGCAVQCAHGAPNDDCTACQCDKLGELHWSGAACNICTLDCKGKGVPSEDCTHCTCGPDSVEDCGHLRVTVFAKFNCAIGADSKHATQEFAELLGKDFAVALGGDYVVRAKVVDRVQVGTEAAPAALLTLELRVSSAELNHLSDSMDERVARKLQSALLDLHSPLHGGAASSLIDSTFGIRAGKPTAADVSAASSSPANKSDSAGFSPWAGSLLAFVIGIVLGSVLIVVFTFVVPAIKARRQQQQQRRQLLASQSRDPLQAPAPQPDAMNRPLAESTSTVDSLALQV